jgi:aspartate racemase
MKNLTIGVLGGMGTYATIHLFKKYAEVFTAEKEWNRPRIIIDNRCTMPSRVRAFLYNEKSEQLVDEMVDSMQSLVNSGCNRIILACNTAHLFLPKIYKKVPELEFRVINIISNCVKQIKNDNVKEIYLLASEGTIDSKIYQDVFEKEGITCNVPKHNDYHLLRQCIEAVKQNIYTEEVKKAFLDLASRHDYILLGCTELPILYEKYGVEIAGVVYDPLLLSLFKLKEEYDDD